MRRAISTAAAVSLPMALAVAGTAQAESTGNATVSVLHGVPGLTVDVFANGEELIPDFEPGTLTDPLTIPAGTYDIQIFPDGEGPDGDPAIEATGVQVPAGVNATIVAHLTEGGDPTATVFVNDLAGIEAGEARVVARHTAAAPAVDVRADGSVIFEGLTNPNEASADVPAGTVSADVVLAGTEEVVLGPADLDLAEGTSTIVYAWGSAEEGTLDLAVQTVSGVGGAPDGVPAGEAGLLDSDGGTGAGWALGAVVAAALLALTVILRRRSRAEADH